MATVKVFSAELQARQFGYAVDAALGLPRNEDPAQGGLGVRVGGGRHGPWPVTEHHGSLYMTGVEWWHPVDDTVQSVDGETVTVGGQEVTVSIGVTVERITQGKRPIPLPDAVPVDVEPGRGGARR